MPKLYVWGTLRKGQGNHGMIHVLNGKFIENMDDGEVYDIPKKGMELLDLFEEAFGFYRKVYKDDIYFYKTESEANRANPGASRSSNHEALDKFHRLYSDKARAFFKANPRVDPSALGLSVNCPLCK